MARAVPMLRHAHRASDKRRRGWLIVGLLFLVQVANYADKIVVGLAAGPIMAEFHLTPSRFGIVTGAFFSLYAVTGLLVAFLAAPRFRPRAIMTVLLIVWTLVQLPVLIAASFSTLVACRVILGMGEGPGTPTALNVAHEWFRSEDRNMPSAVILFGSTAGSMIAAPILTHVIQGFGWRAAFGACAMFGAAVLVLWLSLGADGPLAGNPIREQRGEKVPGGAARLSTDRTLWGVTLVGSAAYWLTGFMVGWLALFLNSLTGDAKQSAWLLSAIFAVQAASVLGVSALSQVMLRAGRTSRLARGAVVGVCMAASGLAFAAAAMMTTLPNKVVLIGIAMSLPAPVFPLCAAMISEVTPPSERNRTMTVIMSILTVAAIPSSLVTGALVGSAGGWSAALLANGVVAVLGATACFVLIDPERSATRLAHGAELLDLPSGARQ